MDPWALVFLCEFEAKTGVKAKQVILNVNSTDLDTNKPHLETLRRRISFLAINNPHVKFVLNAGLTNLELYDQKHLFDRPDAEVINHNVKSRSDKDKPGKLEKDFQAFLFGKGLDYIELGQRTNERLAILGIDFMKIRNKEFNLDREFPTGVFDKVVSSKSRILPTFFIDIVTFNKYGNLSIIELKLDDSSLEVISQLLDYALFARSYTTQIKQQLENKFSKKINNTLIECYMVNNYFHPRFANIINYYKTDKADYGFRLKQVILGHTAAF